MKDKPLIKSKRTLSDDPQYFGSYLNIARHNVFLICNHLAEKFKEKLLKDDEKIHDSFLCTKAKDLYVFTQLIRFLPIAKVFDPEMWPKDERVSESVNLDDLPKIMKACFNDLNGFRNDYTHYYSVATETERKTEVNEDVAQFIRENFQRAISYTLNRFKDTFTDADIEKVRLYPLFESGNKLNQNGLVFFTCLFLDREDAFHFINRVYGLKGTQTREFQATREVFCAYCVRLPYDKFISEDTTQALSLDILNELNRCPKELFDCMDEQSKKEFQPEIGSEEKENIIKSSINPETIEEEDYEEYVRRISSRKRNNDRFDYFALTYLDSLDDSNINFHLNLGKGCIRSYKKAFNGEQIDREIVEDVKIFKKLHDVKSRDVIEDEKKMVQLIDKRKLESEDERFAFTTFNPHFHIANNKIGLRLCQGNAALKTNQEGQPNLKLPSPEVFLSIHELPKLLLLELLQKGKAEVLIKDFIHSNVSLILNATKIEEIKQRIDLPLVKKREVQGKQTFKDMEAYSAEINKRKKCLDNILPSYNLNIRQIPSRIIDYWLNIVDVSPEKNFEFRTKALLKDCKHRLENLEQSNKSPKVGQMATFLAKDLVDMVIDNTPQLSVKNKITSFYYNKLQESLALFSGIEHKEVFYVLCSTKECGFDSPNIHPFLYKTNYRRAKNISELYKSYLNQKQNWIEKCFYVKQGQKTKIILPDETLEPYSKIPFTIKNQIRPTSDFNDWLKNVTHKPIDLPTNLFDETLCHLLREKTGLSNDNKEKYSVLLARWMENDTQPFYNSDRVYKVYDETVTFTPGTKKAYKDYFQDAMKKPFKLRKSENSKLEIENIRSVFNHAIVDNEKNIRYSQTKDRILLLLFRELCKDGVFNKLKLCTIKDALNQNVSVKESISGKPKNGNELSRTVVGERKMKDFSVFRKLIFDRRLPDLFEYYETEEIPYLKLIDELNSYNAVKELVFDRVFELEKAIMSKSVFKSEIIGMVDNETNVQHKPYLSWLLHKGLISQSDYNFLLEIRDAFSHSQFPQQNEVGRFMNRDCNKSFSVQIFEKYDEKMKEVIKKIEAIG